MIPYQVSWLSINHISFVKYVLESKTWSLERWETDTIFNLGQNTLEFCSILVYVRFATSKAVFDMN